MTNGETKKKMKKKMKQILWGNKKVRQDFKAEIFQDSGLVMMSVILGYNIPFITGIAEFTGKAMKIQIGLGVALFLLLIGLHKETKNKLRLQQLADI